MKLDLLKSEIGLTNCIFFAILIFIILNCTFCSCFSCNFNDMLSLFHCSSMKCMFDVGVTKDKWYSNINDEN